MKRIIDISEDYYELIKHEVVEYGNDYKPFVIIANSTPLNEVEAKDCISREKTLDILVSNWQSQEGDDAMQSSINEITVLPTVYPKNYKPSGKWITLKDEWDDIVEAVCSVCDSNGYHKWKYCPNCGAKMFESQESEAENGNDD